MSTNFSKEPGPALTIQKKLVFQTSCSFTKEDIKAIAVEGAIWPKALTRLAGSALQDGGVAP